MRIIINPDVFKRREKLMRHEVRTYFNAIFGITELLRDTPLNQEQQDYLDILEDSSQKLMTLVEVILPPDNVALPSPTSLSQPSSSLAPQPHSIIARNLKILVVDDHEANRALILAFLKKEECEITVATNGLEAFEKFKEISPDLVLMDIQMPLMDGCTATQHIRQWERENQSSPSQIFALTAFATSEWRQKCLDSGCNSYLTKPLTRDILLKAIQEEFGLTHSPICVEIDAFLQDLIPEYLATTRNEISILKSALDKGDFETMQVLGHRMRGVGGSYGFEGLSRIGQGIEEHSQLRNPVKLKHLILELQEYINNIQIQFINND
jgi:CheY-like chemotaxis protein